MSTEFGWWDKNPVDGKFQVRAAVHGGNLAWARKQGHHTPWKPHQPAESDWDQLLKEASKRVVRRLLSPKQFDEIKRMHP